jgi:hypothetical protein
MINGFERETHELNDYELTLVPLFVAGLKTKTRQELAITNKKICAIMKERGHKVSEVRIRKIINFIRTKKLIVNLISSSKGYWIAENQKQLTKYVQSLDQRINEIQRVRNSFN